ncbi:neural cell adhesion molecule 2-like [Penaeus japonicus]|uniref:neural cell adhesion molecule 2-like n=1 Tax=Penaeus japonicus TaxID=27405 RepID=UPI001C712A94|nr:neural cell adhesion molecule 2-like [Penaeus japonicus]
MSKVLLPCDVSPPLSSDDTILVLFYRGSIGTPIFSIDGRSGPVHRADTWTDDSTLGQRAYLDVDTQPPGLVLNPVKASDRDLYRCRVDYSSSPTRNVRIQLNVVVPPRKVHIVNEKGMDVNGVIGPYHVSVSVKLQCRAEGGEPRPSVTWWSGGTLLDDVSEDRRGDVTINTLTLHSIARHDLYRVLTCQVVNSNLSEPVTSSVTLDMSFPPLTVKIMSLKEELSEGEKYKIVCESSGSRPSASITWWKNGMLMTDARKQVFQEGNITRSTLHLTPSPADNDVYISCRAENPRVPTAVIEDSAKLNVHYTPRLSLAAGQNLDMEDIKEGDDLYFECGIQANPRVYKVQWFHNGEELSHNVSAGVIQSNQSLVLQRVTRASSGDYKCTAANLHGSSESNSVHLSVKFAPLCAEGQKVMYGAGKQEELNVSCSVEAHPPPFAFRWAFNSSSEVIDITPSMTRMVSEGVSQVSYAPVTHMDYGSLLCWATNDVSRQITPCIYHIIHATSPDAVNNCTVENVSSTGAAVRCQAGWDGGLAQTFTLSVSHARAHTRGHDKKNEAPRVLANTSTSPRPEFSLTGLQAGTEYVLTIMGVNKKGQSDPVRLRIFTLKDKAEKRTSPGAEGLALAHILAVVLGVVVTLLLVGVVIVVVIRSRRRGPQRPEVKMVYDKGSSGSPSGRGQETATDSEEANPDVIPVNDDHQVQKPVGEDLTEVLPESDPHHSPPPPQPSQSSPPVQPDLHHDPRVTPALQDFPSQDNRLLEYLKERDRSYYMDPSTILRQNLLKALSSEPRPAIYHLAGYQKPPVAPRDVDPLLMVGHPLAGATPSGHAMPAPSYELPPIRGHTSYPTDTTPPPTSSPPYAREVPSAHAGSSLPRRQSMLLPSYAHDYAHDFSGTSTLPRSFSRDLPSYGQGAAHPPYAQNRLSLGLSDILAAERAMPLFASSRFSSTSAMSGLGGAERPRASLAAAAPTTTREAVDDAGSQRESSV